jgi:hypothetical protein
MLQAFLKRKVQRYLRRNAEDIEDLVTSVILGICEYADRGLGILPFILRAQDKNQKKLESMLVMDDVE